MKKNNETYIQIYLCSFLRKLQILEPNFIFFSIPNGGTRNAREAMNLKMSGLLPGAPDLVIMGNDGKFNFIELKKIKGTLSTAQKEFIKLARSMGWSVDVIYADNPEQAIDAIIPIIEPYGYHGKSISSVKSTVLAPLAVN